MSPTPANERNIAALMPIYADWHRLLEDRKVSGFLATTLETEARAFAEFVAARGCLMPSALSEENLISIAATNWKEIGTDLPATLAAIARGDEGA